MYIYTTALFMTNPVKISIFNNNNKNIISKEKQNLNDQMLYD